MSLEFPPNYLYNLAPKQKVLSKYFKALQRGKKPSFKYQGIKIETSKSHFTLSSVNAFSKAVY